MSCNKVDLLKFSYGLYLRDFFKSQYAGYRCRVVTAIATSLISNIPVNAFSKGGVRI